MSYGVAGTEVMAFWVFVNHLVRHRGKPPAVILISTQNTAGIASLRFCLKVLQRSGFIYVLYSAFNFMLPKLIAILPRALSHYKSIDALAAFHRIRVIESQNLSQEKIRELLAKLGVKTLISFCCDHIFVEPLLSAPGLKIVNLHPSRLPDYKGVDPIFEQIANGQRRGFLTLHEVAAKIDSGPIIAVKEWSFDSFCHFERVYACAEKAADMASAYLEGSPIKASVPQDGVIPQHPYRSWPQRTRLPHFRQQGGSFFPGWAALKAFF